MNSNNIIELIESVDGHSCMYDSMDTYRPGPMNFTHSTFDSEQFLNWYPYRRVVETPTHLIISGCDDDTRATVAVYFVER